ncbi:hypothetical protein ABPG74_009829 [Tetrahymena malaccensis]
MKHFDIFGAQVSLSYTKDNLFRTPFGGGITFFCFFFIIILCYSNHQQLAQVNYTTSTNYSTEPSTVSLGADSQMIAISYDQKNFITRPMVNITLYSGQNIRYPNGTVLQIRKALYLEPCTLQHFTSLPSYNSNWTQIFQEQNLQDYLCLQKNQSYKVGGVFVNNNFYFLKFSVSACVNSTGSTQNPWNPVCEQASIIQQSVNQYSRIRFVISNNILNPEKPINSITSFLDSQIFNVQFGQMYTTANIFINQQKITTDESIFPISSLHTEELLQFRQSDVQQQNSVGNFSVYADFYIQRSNYSTVAQKSFLKLDQVISYIGGFCQVFFLVSAFLVSKYNSYIFYNELANRLYDFDVYTSKKSQSKGRANNIQPQIENLESKVENQNFQSPIKGIVRANNTSKDNNLATTPSYMAHINNHSYFKENNQVDLNENNNQNQNNLTVLNLNENIKTLNDSIIPLYLQKIDLPHLVQPSTIQIKSFKKEAQEEQLKILNKISDSLAFQQADQNQHIQVSNPQFQAQKSIKDTNYEKFQVRKIKSQTACVKFNSEDCEEQTNNYAKQSQIIPKNLNNSYKLGYSASEYLKQQIRYITDRKKHLWIDFKYLMNQLTCGKFFNTPEIKLLNKAFSLVNQDLDIFTVLERQKEIDKLKKLFLNEDQQALFNFFPKPVIKIIDDNAVLSLQQIKKEEEEIEQSVKKIQKNKKNINTKIKNFGIIVKAIIRFKQGRKSNVSCYQKLFNHYQKLSQQMTQDDFQQKINKNLIHLLGDEMNDIFLKTNKIKQQNEHYQQLLKQQQNKQPCQFQLTTENFGNDVQPYQNNNFQYDFTQQIQQQNNEFGINQNSLEKYPNKLNQGGLILFTDNENSFQYSLSQQNYKQSDQQIKNSNDVLENINSRLD